MIISEKFVFWLFRELAYVSPFIINGEMEFQASLLISPGYFKSNSPDIGYWAYLGERQVCFQPFQ